jgi:hypothetical protein
MNAKSVASGAVCIAIGGYFASSALTHLKVGSTTNMGPGYFPLMLAFTIILVGTYITARAFRETPEPLGITLGTLPIRGILLLSLAPILLGLTIRGLGLAPAVFLISMVSAYASRTQTLRLALLVSVLLAVFCALIFGVVLKLPIPLIGPWLNF